jgi:hypothetical protein
VQPLPSERRKKKLRNRNEGASENEKQFLRKVVQGIKQRALPLNEHMEGSMRMWCTLNYPEELSSSPGELCASARDCAKNQGSASDFIMREQKKYFKRVGRDAGGRGKEEVSSSSSIEEDFGVLAEI